MKGIGSGKVVARYMHNWNVAEVFYVHLLIYFPIYSGPNDHIFINFVDHGAPGLLAFPSSELHARALQDTLLDMNQNNKYGKLVMVNSSVQKYASLCSHFNFIFSITSTSKLANLVPCLRIFFQIT